MPTDTARRPADAAAFVWRAAAWSLGFSGLLRVSWIEANVVLAFTRAQSALAVRLVGAPSLPVDVTTACSGTDAIALCAGAILAYPVPWRRRLAGVGTGIALILGLNILRIGTLGRVASSPSWFHALHVWVWPGALTLAIAAYVFWWMHAADDAPNETQPVAQAAPRPTRRFVASTVVLLIAFVALSPLYLESQLVLAVARLIARSAANLLNTAGVGSYAIANVLWTPRGSFLVTQECIATPLVPVYLAAVWTFAPTRRRLILGVAATVPLFVALGIVRLLVVALPANASPIVLVHAFYQLLLGAVVVYVAALWSHGKRTAVGHAIAGIIVGVVFVQLIGETYTRLVAHPAGLPIDDPQGAIAMLPAFQVGLYLALWVAGFAAIGWVRFAAGLATLAATQAAGLLVLHAIASQPGISAHVRDVRGWAVTGPVIIFAAMVTVARPRR